MQQKQQDGGHAKLAQEQLLQASTELMHHSLGYLNSMALGCAAKLGVADAIHRAGGRASLDDLHAALSLGPSKLPYLRRVMRVLVASGVFAHEQEAADVDNAGGGGGGYYSLTPVSSLLVTTGAGAGASCRSLLPLVLLHHSPALCVTPATGMAEWLKSGKEETAFEMTHGAGLWSVCSRTPELGELFNDAMAADSTFIMDLAIRGAGQVFDKITSLVDVAGGTGAAARAVAIAFPHIKCTVLDLPHVIGSIPTDHGGDVQFVAGDMMDCIPQADALLLKFVLHDWSDVDCVKILKQCKEAIPSREAGGKVIIIDVVVGSSSQATSQGTQLLFDLIVSTMLPGMERNEKEWCKIFKEAGFTEYKISPVLGFRSIIEVFP
ncbi:5-pentadecatrienyl resorcinol O-methyltransferase-like isoform X1 [Oryza brachyantha]|uniref:5-pentadecatrienyl resorcinol O-methyltransferase-like isoform X1 n=1 Tax=Oryza brachyantha TaxID=4533 RepID=UPI001ADD1F29|nr:5-pentadecatrienyl resorcinol O-methyltransferase-like isoform X1 [Oryza brachyantha]